MADLITQKQGYTHAVSHSLTYTFPVVNNNQPDTKKTFSDVIKENKSNIFAGGLFSVGALFIYLGVSRPDTAKAFNKYIDKRITDMGKIVNEYCAQLGVYIESSFIGAMNYISKYRASRIVDPSAYLPRINSSSDPKQLITVQDTVFNILNRMNKHCGANDMDTFAVKLFRTLRRVSNETASGQNRVERELEDYKILPTHVKINEELLQSGAERLGTEFDNFVDYIVRVRGTKLNTISQFHFKQMADAITESRCSKSKTKESILNASFKKVREILGLGEDFIPMYQQQRYDLGDLSKKNLAPLSIPDEIVGNFEHNIFIDTIKKKNLASLSEKDLRVIYQNISSEYNLKDLRYLIDRIRLRSAVCSANPEIKAEADLYQQMEIRLKYLSNILNDIGEKELLRSCDCDFGNLSTVQRQAKMYYISKNSRRMGYENFSIMNSEMLGRSEEYGKLELSRFAEEIENNPELYFIG